MAMAGFRVSYHHRLFILVLAFACTVVSIFVVFQYDREKEYKIELLNARLQAFNRELITDQGKQEIDNCIRREGIDHLRVTLIDRQGTVIYDNTTAPDKYSSSGNHSGRPEVQKAMAEGEGYTVMRHSASTDDVYFYSATLVGDIVVRSAVPYSLSLLEVLDADKGFLWFIAAITIAMTIVAWFATRHIGQTVSRLNRFAACAEQGKKIYEDEAFPHDELGEIAQHIVRLYAQSERRHEETLRQEQDKIRIKKQLTNNINHELKTPVAAMQVCLETLISHPDLPEEKRNQFIHRCYDNSKRLLSLLMDVSVLARLDDGSTFISKEPLSLRMVVAEVVKEQSVPDALPVCVDISPDIYINATPSLLHSIFSNLIRNANSYSQGNSINISATTGNGKVTVIFSDDGTGIPAEHLPHIFERFYRIDKGRSRAKGGTGLGLAIVKNAVLFHQGSIEAFNISGGGLGFRITFPCLSGPAESGNCGRT